MSYTYRQPADADKTGAPPSGIFYSLRNKNLRSTKVYYHKFGDACEGSEAFAPNDKLLFESKNEMFRVAVGTTGDGEYVLVRHGSNTENELRQTWGTRPQLRRTSTARPSKSRAERG